MSNIFLISDQHYSHGNILTFFKNDDVTRLREFSSIEEMDETMIANHNSVVSSNDKVYHLGDVCFTNRVLEAVMPRLNGEHILIKGNHDVLKLCQYSRYFKDIRGSHVLDKMILTHIPIHPESMSRWRMNIHGHLHSNTVQEKIPGLGCQDDHRYLNMSVERWNYTPVPFETVRQIALNRGR